MMKIAGLVAIVSIVVITVSCAVPLSKWEHPDIPSAEWGVDGAQCKYEARRNAEREGRISEAEQNLYGDEDDSIGTMIAIADNENRARKLFDHCMRELGYIPVE